ncbi:MAG: hypothetical protein LBV48_00510, partial [Mycoplasmataceae bacterium]|nr:hypothetical protein [Mycoplasmataceae bacterium]
MENIDKIHILLELENELKNASNETKLIEIKNIFIKNKLSPLYGELIKLPNDQKSVFGKTINEIKIESNALVEKYLIEMRSIAEAKAHIVDYDITINTSNFTKGSLSPITLVFKEILAYFQSLNFTIQSGEEILSPKYNFDNLNIPSTHPTRETSETFYTKTSSLRTQLTASSAQFIENNQA